MFSKDTNSVFKIFKYENTNAFLFFEDDILQLETEGIHDIRLAKESFSFMLSSLLRLNRYKCIINISNLTGHVSSIEKYDYMEFVRESLRKYFTSGGVPPKIAYVLNSDYLESNKGFTDVLRKEYSLRLHSFPSVEEAKVWLAN